MNDHVSILEIVKHSDIDDLHQFIIDYANNNKEFRLAFNARFSPANMSTGSKETYAGMVSAAFANNPFSGGGRYRQWDDYGFDAEGVRAGLELLLNKIVWVMKSENFDEAILICQAIIETIPDEWEEQFDQEGDVQVMYDGAIDHLQEMLAQDVLSKTQKANLFEWFCKESIDKKHRYVGLNTSLNVLENYFTDTLKCCKKTLII